MFDYPQFSEFLRSRYGSTWVIAPRLTARLRDKGYTVAIGQARYGALRDEWRDGHPLVEYARQLPPGPMQAELFIAACERVDRAA